MKKNFCVKFILSYEFDTPIFCMTNEPYKLRGRNALIIGTPYDFFIIRLLGHI